MCFGNTMDENKQHLKKSIAKMMVFWVVNSRHTLREELLAKNRDNLWAELDLKNAFDSLEEYQEFFERTADIFNEDVDTKGATSIKAMKLGAERINDRVDGRDGMKDANGELLKAEWCPTLVVSCPDNRVINVMFNAALAFVDNVYWEEMPSVSERITSERIAIEAAKKLS